MKKINKDELEHKQLKSNKSGELYSFSHVVSDFFGAKQVFLAHDIITPHKKSSSAHRHSSIEEIVFVSKGQLVVLIGDKKEIVQEGAFIFFDPKDKELHCLINESDSDVETITFSTKRQGDQVIYDNANLWSPPIVETSRLVLRPIRNSDLHSIFEYCSLPEVSRFTTWEAHRNIDDSMKLVEYAHANYQRGLCEPVAITLKENPEKLIGTVGWFWSSERYKSIELAYALSPKYWGMGLVVEACRGLVNDALKSHDIQRITSRCIAENIPSARVMEKLGMEHEGTQKQLMDVKGKFVDIKNYCVLIKDWKSGNP